MPEKVAYTLMEAAQVYPVSYATLQRAIHTTSSSSFPPPLRAKRLGRGAKAKYVVLASDLLAWHALLPDA